MPTSSVKFSVNILTWNGGKWLADCLNALKPQVFRDFEILVVDDESTDGSSDHMEERFPCVRVLPLTEYHGFAKAVNAGIKEISGVSYAP